MARKTHSLSEGQITPGRDTIRSAVGGAVIPFKDAVGSIFGKVQEILDAQPNSVNDAAPKSFKVSWLEQGPSLIHPKTGAVINTAPIVKSTTVQVFVEGGKEAKDYQREIRKQLSEQDISCSDLYCTIEVEEEELFYTGDD